MLIIPLLPTPSQTVSVQLGGQDCSINVYQKSIGLFVDLAVASVPLLSGMLCVDRNVLVRDAYHGFIGDLAFRDTQGTADPVSSGLGGRYQFLWLAPADLAAAGLSA